MTAITDFTVKAADGTAASPGSCPPNWLHGNPSTSNPRAA